ncbi:hypothetical protein HK096_007597, partial [Nowakowskiella sp. JEL0078]
SHKSQLSKSSNLMPLPIESLRDQLLQASDNSLGFLADDGITTVSNLQEASFLSIPSLSPLNLLQPSGFKDYSLLSVLFFIENQTLDFSAYMQRCLAFSAATKKEATVISFLDKKSLMDFLSQAAPVQTKRSADESLRSEHKKQKIQDPNFAGVIRMGIEVFKKEKEKQPPAQKLTTQPSKTLPAPSRISSSSNRTASFSRTGKSKTNENLLPIIIVPAGRQDSLNLWNIVDFLEHRKYVSPLQNMKYEDGKPKAKPDEVIVAHTPDNSGVSVSYQIVDSVAKFRSDD